MIRHLCVVSFVLIIASHSVVIQAVAAATATYFRPHDPVNSLSFGICGVPNYNRSEPTNQDQFEFQDRFVAYKPTYENNVDYSQRLQELKTNLTIIRMLVLYDDTMLAEFKSRGKIERYIRNILYQNQLTFERPELWAHLRLYFMITDIRKANSSYGPNLSGPATLLAFSKAPDFTASPEADLKVLMVYKEFASNPEGTRVLGVSYIGSICRKTSRAALVLIASTTGSARVLAHEIGHALNSNHDGLEKNAACPEEGNIMKSTLSPTAINWSKCAIKLFQDFLADTSISSCLNDPNRLKNAKPYTDAFDFRPEEGNLNRKPLPGEEMNVDEQCQFSLDSKAVSGELHVKYNAVHIGEDQRVVEYENCQEAACFIKGYGFFGIGASFSGSFCRARNSEKFNGEFREGVCLNSRCQQNFGAA